MATPSLKQIVGSVKTIETFQKTTYLHLITLSETTKDGNTHAIVNDDGETVGFAYEIQPGDGYNQDDKYLLEYLQHRYQFICFRPGLIQPHVEIIKQDTP